MENLLLISEVAQELGQHSNAARIKKLIFATWKNRWENDLSTIDKFPLTNIIQELVNSNPTPEQLRVVFFNIVNTLNKKEEYTVIAEIILMQMDSLYLCQEPKTEMVYRVVTPSQSLPIYPNPVPAALPVITPTADISSPLDTITNVKVTLDNNLELESIPNSSPSLNLNSSPSVNLSSSGYDPFAVRLAVMKYSNPLRAKILLLCVLEEQSSFSQGSWLKLRSRNLDELLIDVFQKFSSIEQLESQLHRTANGLQEPDENAQAAEAIVKAMKPFYQKAMAIN
jgi:hypothetical protein